MLISCSTSRHRASILPAILCAVVSVAAAGELDFDKDAKPFLQQYCSKCHNAEKAKGGVNLAAFNSEVALYRFRERTEEVATQLAKKEMPPEDAPQPDDVQRQKLAAWLRWKLEHFDPDRFRNPGYMPSHRLTRTQYRNTIRDLIGLGKEVVENLPSDEATFGFDQIGDVQEVSAVHMEKYLEAANYMLDRVFIPSAQKWEFDPRKLEYIRQFGLSGDDKDIPFPKDAAEHEVTADEHIVYHTGGVTLTHDFPYTGYYAFKVRVWGDQAAESKRGPSIKVKLDAHRVAEFGVPSGGKKRIEERVSRFIVRAGRHDVKFEMEGMAVNMTAADQGKRFNRTAFVGIEVSGPFAESDAKATEIRQRVMAAEPGPNLPPRAAAQKILERFATRAFRRDLKPGELDRILAFYDRAASRGDSFDNAVKLALKAILLSPNFLFHIEEDHDTKEAYRVAPFELANRLSYFIWNSMPDEELFESARSGKLLDATVLEAQARRMLKDSKSRALAENFAPQWLGLGNLFAVHREGKFHPNNLREREDALEEVVQFFDYIVRSDRPIMELLTADYSFANKFLAEHYGVPNAASFKPRDFVRVQFKDDLAKRRGGLLGMTAVYISTSHPKDTNPSGRGKWVLDTLLGTPPPPPPANVALLKEEKNPTATLRERLTQHRSDPNCASCHAKIDPIGFALENYDTVGAWRDKEAGKPLDVSGQCPDGKRISGPAELRNYLATDKRELFLRNFSKRFLIFALRRGLDFYDEGTLQEMRAAVAKEDSFSAVVLAIVKSYPFQNRQQPNAEMNPK